MPEQVTIDEGFWDDKATYTLWKAICATRTELGGDFITKFGYPADQKFPFTLDVCLTVNGVEVPVMETLAEFFKKHENWIEEQCRDYLKKKCAAVSNVLDRMYVSGCEAIDVDPYP